VCSSSLALMEPRPGQGQTLPVAALAGDVTWLPQQVLCQNRARAQLASHRRERIPEASLVKENRMSSTEQTDLPKALIEHLAEAVIFADRDGVIRLWNPGAHADFGYSADEVLGRRLDVLIPERLRPRHWAAFDAAIETGEMKHGRESMATRSLHKDATDLYLDLSFALVKDAHGHVLGAAAVARDITGRFRAEKESRRRIEDLQQQLEALKEQGS
jgi:PAS domain S-box-containing protein